MAGGGKYKRALWAGLASLFMAAMALTLDPLGSFNALMPKDRASVRVAQGIVFGPGERLKLDVYAPRAASVRPRPVILFFYGGSWNSGRREGYAFAARGLAARGFVVIVPDYRLVPEVRYPDFLRDCAAAVRWARRHSAEHGGDGERIVLTGHSAGAYNVAMLALDPSLLGPDRSAVRGLVGLAGPYDFLPLDDDSTIEAFGAWPRPAETQPITHAVRGAPPALLLHGDLDSRVKPRNSRKLADLLRAAGSDAELKLYPGIGHAGILTALALPFRGRAPVLADVAAFAREVTGENDREGRP
ncbi:MAG TPA: alpha/beta hydrolase [Allosphingosinicella sp.]|nr:alpha/beta hydrolase [Allosphingosinicella sp.]